MVAHFKIKPGPEPVYEITVKNVEKLLGRRPPWFQQGKLRGDGRHFAVCPYCDNPVQLIGLYKTPRPHGSHVGKAVDGFVLDLEDMAFCPYRIKHGRGGKSARRKMGPVALALIAMAISEFDRIVVILRDDFGFPFSDAFAGRMLDQWFDSEGYLYTRAHLRNLPWMVAYLGPAQNLFGQRVGANAELANAIRERAPVANISDEGRLERGKKFYRLDLQCLDHKVELDEKEHTLHESLTLRIQNFTSTNEPTKAPTVYKKQIDFNPDRFEALMRTPPEQAQRDEQLLALARDIASKRGFE